MLDSMPKCTSPQMIDPPSIASNTLAILNFCVFRGLILSWILNMLGLAALCGAIHSTFCKLAALLPPSTLAITKLLKQGRVTADHRMRLRLFLFELLELNVQNRFFPSKDGNWSWQNDGVLRPMAKVTNIVLARGFKVCMLCSSAHKAD